MNAAPLVSPVYRIHHPLPLDSGQVLENCEIAYETYGTLRRTPRMPCWCATR